MKKLLFLAPLLALSLAGCAAVPGIIGAMAGVPAAPAQVASQTVLDEQAAISVELAYKAARIAMETAVDSGALTGASASRAAEIDNQAFAAVTGVRAAYRAGNANQYSVALGEARAAVANMLAAIHPAS